MQRKADEHEREVRLKKEDDEAARVHSKSGKQELDVELQLAAEEPDMEMEQAGVLRDKMDIETQLAAEGQEVDEDQAIVLRGNRLSSTSAMRTGANAVTTPTGHDRSSPGVVVPFGAHVTDRKCDAKPISTRVAMETCKQTIGVMRRQASATTEQLKSVVDKNGGGHISCMELVFAPIWLHRYISYIKMPVMKVFAAMRFLDLYCRFLFPAAYIPFVLFKFSQVNWGRDWEASRAMSTCP